MAEQINMSLEELLAQLQTRGFEEGFQRTTLRDFYGDLESIGSETAESNGRSWINAMYNFTNLEVIKSTEPYTLPIAQISIGISKRKASAMGVFGDSIDKLLNVDEEGNPLPSMIPGPDGEDMPNPDLKGQGYLIGKRLRMVMTPGHMQWDRNKGMETPRENWELKEVVGETAPYEPGEGEAPVEQTEPEPAPAPVVAKPAAAPKAATKAKAPAAKTTIQIALALLNGKTQQEFNNAAFKDANIKKDGALVQKLIQGKFISEFTASGLVTLGKDGKYTVDPSLM